MKEIGSDPILILGVERCGSTWLSNIFDSSPDTIFYMEPFAQFAKIFEGFPDRLSYISCLSSNHRNILQHGFENLYSDKYPFLQTHSSGKLVNNSSYYLLKAQDRIARIIHPKDNLQTVKYELLNLNWKEDIYFPLKNEDISNICIKELRLNFKIALLKEYFPNARYVVVIRNLLVQIYSIMNLFNKESLGQLKGNLDSVFSTIKENNRFEKYRFILPHLNQDSVLDQAITYWFINNNTLIEDLSSFNCKFNVVMHEELSGNCENIVSELFKEIGLTFTSSVRQYIDQSTSGTNNTSSPVDTSRNSKTYYAEIMNKIDSQFKNDVARISKHFWEISTPEVRSYESSVMAWL